MADNVDVTPGAGKTVATDDIAGVHYQRVKTAWGPDGTANDTDTASGKPLPTQIRKSDGTEVAFNANGQATMANSAPVAIASNQSAVPVTEASGTAIAASLSIVDDWDDADSCKVKSGGSEYETVPASSTDLILGPTGGVGDYLEGIICVVATAATSQVQIKDGNGSAITVLPNAVGAGVGTYYVPLGLKTVNATTPGWKITTAAGVSVIGLGDFT